MRRMKRLVCAMLVVWLALLTAYGVADTHRPAVGSKVTPNIGDRVYLNPIVYYNEENTTPDDRYIWVANLKPYAGEKAQSIKHSNTPEHNSPSNTKYKLTVYEYRIWESVQVPAYSDLYFSLSAKVGAELVGKTIGKTMYVGICSLGNPLYIGPGHTQFNVASAGTREKNKMLSRAYQFNGNNLVLENSTGSGPIYGNMSEDGIPQKVLDLRLFTFVDMGASAAFKGGTQAAGKDYNYAYATVTGITNYIYYEENGAPEGTAPATQTKSGNKSIKLSTKKLSKANSVHVGWNTQADGKGTHYDFGATYSGTSGVKLYAEWRSNRTLTFDFNDIHKDYDVDKVGRANEQIIVTDDSTNNNNVASLNPVRAGYTFDGWYTSKTGGTKVYNSNGSCVSGSYWNNNGQWIGGGSVSTLYAHWTPNIYKVTLDRQSGTGGTSSYWYKYQYDYNKEIDGTTFTIYYYDDAACTQEHYLNGNKTEPANTYKFNPPAKNGFNFKGYYTHPDGGGTQYIDQNGMGVNNIYKVFPNNVTLYAHWTEISAEPPVFHNPLLQEQNHTLTYGYNDTVTLTVNAAMHSSLNASQYAITYQWKKDGVDISGATGSSYTIPKGSNGLSAGRHEYVCVVTSTVIETGKKAPRSTMPATIVVNKATPTVTWPAIVKTNNDGIYVNDTLTLSGGSASFGGKSVSGTFSITGANSWEEAGNQTTKLTFTPNDTQNYNTVTSGDVTVAVSKRTITSVQAFDAITGKEFGTLQGNLDLPQTVQITTADNKKFDVPVNWAGYNANTTEEQMLTGTLDLSSIDNEVQQSNPALAATITVTLLPRDPYSENWSSEDNAPIWENETFTYANSPVSHEIPDSIVGVESVAYSYQGSGSTNYGPSTTPPKNAGTYQVTATFTMENGYNALDSQTSYLTILPRPLTVKANDHTITYGDAPSANGVNYDDGMTDAEVDGDMESDNMGFADGEDESILQGTLAYTYSYERYGDVGEYTITPSGLSAANYNITFKAGKLTVQQKEIGVEWDENALQLVYNTQAQKPTAKAEDTVNSDQLGLTVDGAGTNVGTYTATVTGITGDKARNYKLPVPEAQRQTQYTIINAAQSAPESAQGVHETIKAKGDGQIVGVNSTMEWRAEGETVYTPVDGTAVTGLTPGKYMVRYAAKDNYNASGDATVTIEAGRKMTLTVPETQVGYHLESRLAGSESFAKSAIEYDWDTTAGNDVELKFTLNEGYSQVEGFGIVDLNDAGRIITLQDGRAVLSSLQADVALQVNGVADITPPTAQIAIEPDMMSRMMKRITFDQFYKQNLIVTITAQDAGSGMKSIEYSVQTAEVENPAQITDWTPYTAPFKLEIDSTYVIYARVTDNDNNRAHYDSENGVVLDKTAPALTLIEDGGVYYGDTKFKVTDTNFDHLMLDGVEVTPDQDGCCTITADNKEHTIIAHDKAGNSTTYTIEVYKIYTVTFVAEGKEVHSVPVNHGWDTPMIEVPNNFGEGEKSAYWDHSGKNITQDTTITAIYLNGEIKDVTEPEKNFGAAVIENTLGELLVSVPIEEREQFMIDRGADILVWIETKDINANVPQEEQILINTAKKDTGCSLSYCMDISMFKKIGQAEKVQLRVLNSPVTISLKVPGQLLNVAERYVRTYRLARVHDGVLEEIPVVFDPLAQTLTFESDRFSTYVIMCYDGHIPLTGDRSALSMWLALMAVSCVLLMRRGKSRNMTA